MEDNNQQNQQPMNTESETTATPVTSDTSASADGSAMQTNRRLYYTIGAVVLVVLVLGGLLFIMERSGQVNTGLFSGIERKLSEQKTVAVVNGENISAYDLSISQEQIKAGAEAQGVDVSSPEIQAEIKNQAVEVLINTELLLQEAEKRGIAITDEEVTTRYDMLVQEVGGAEILAERMGVFGITETILMRDIRNELAIQKLLDQVFEQETIDVTEAEINDLYESAGGEAAGLPPLSEVEEQIRQQIISTKEQEIVNTFISSLREAAEIEILLTE